LLLFSRLFYNFATLYPVIFAHSKIWEALYMTLSANYPPADARIRLARVLLDNATEPIPQKHQLAQSDMAKLGDMGWETVNASLRSLQKDGVIKLERHRIIINRKMLKETVEASTPKMC
jgi:Crp-like helix-turn-helix domain